MHVITTMIRRALRAHREAKAWREFDGRLQALLRQGAKS